MTGCRWQATGDLQAEIAERIELVQGNFRQELIKASWADFFHTLSPPTLPVLSFRATVSSGTYIRSLVHRLGRSLGCGAVTYDINRTQVEHYSLAEAITIPVGLSLPCLLPPYLLVLLTALLLCS